MTSAPTGAQRDQNSSAPAVGRCPPPPPTPALRPGRPPRRTGRRPAGRTTRREPGGLAGGHPASERIRQALVQIGNLRDFLYGASQKVRNLRQFLPLFAAHTHRCARMWTRIFAATSTGEGGRSATEKARHDWRGLLCHCRVRCICGRDRRTLIRPAQLHLGSILNYGHERERASRRVHATDVWLHFNALTLDAGVRWTLLAGPACASLCVKRLGPERALSSRASGPRTGGPAAGRWQAGGPPLFRSLSRGGTYRRAGLIPWEDDLGSSTGRPTRRTEE
jgi:hypothetical protein